MTALILTGILAGCRLCMHSLFRLSCRGDSRTANSLRNMAGKKRSSDDSQPAASKPTKATKATKAVKVKSEAPALEAPEVTPPATGLNAPFFAKHYEDVEWVKQNIVEVAADPLSVSQGGLTAGFDSSEVLESLRTRGSALTVANLLWLDSTWSPTAHVPLRWENVDRCKKYWEKNWRQMLERNQIEVAILKSDIEGGELPARGTWKRVSPEEVCVWLFTACAVRLRSRAVLRKRTGRQGS